MTPASTQQKFFRFILIGGLGFIADAGLLLVFIQMGLNPFAARVVSISVTMIMTWRLNRALTFGPSHDSAMKEAARYFSVAVTVAALNYVVYASLLVAVANCPPVLATALATGVCTLVSFLGYGRFAFRR